MDKVFGHRLRTLRLRAGLTATALAGDALSVATVSRLEHGAIEPSLTTLRYLAARLGSTPADLLRPEREAAQDALAMVEACLLLDRPLRARALAAQATERLEIEADADTNDPEDVLLRHRLRWAAVRAEAALEPGRAPELLRGALAAATAESDDWSIARLTLTSATLPTTEGTLPLLTAALARLPAAPSPSADSPGDQLIRAQLQLRLAQAQEREGARETARGLYRQATIATADLRQPDRLASALLPDKPPTEVSTWTAPIIKQQGASDVEMTPSLALAFVVAARRVWTTAMLALARLDIATHRHAVAAQRLSEVQAAGGLDMLASSEWSAVFSSAGPSALPPLTEALEGISLGERERQRALVDLLTADAYLQAGKLDEAERLAATTAASLGVLAPRAAQHIWHRLALAWADAGQAPRAAQALRAGLGS